MAQAITLKSPFIPSLNIEILTSSSGFVSKCYEGYAQFIQKNGEALAQTLGNAAGKLTRGILLPLSICQFGKEIQNKIGQGADHTTQLPIRLVTRGLQDIHWITMAGGLSTAIAFAFFQMNLMPVAFLTTAIYLSSLIYKQFSYSINFVENNDEKRSSSSQNPALKEKEITHIAFDTFPLSCFITGKLLYLASETPPPLVTFLSFYGLLALPNAYDAPLWARYLARSVFFSLIAAYDFPLVSKIAAGMIACETGGMLIKKGIFKFHSSPQYHHLKNSLEAKFSNIQKLFSKSKSNLSLPCIFPT